MPQGKGTYGSTRGRPPMKKNSPKEKSTVRLGGKKIVMKKDALRNQLKVPEGRNIPMSLINKILKAEVGDEMSNPFGGKIKITALLKRRANLGKTLKKM
jgi:hypothetical protein